MRTLALAAAAAAGLAFLPAAAAHAAASAWCFQVSAPYNTSPATGACAAGYASVAVPAGTAQVLTVTNQKQASSYASFNAFSLTGGTWVHTWGSWTARIGAAGFANPGQKIEGDVLTPQGTYGFQFMFGVNANPGVHFQWRHAYRYDYWDDDPRSSRYNLWTDIRHYPAGKNPEPMHNVPSYNYAAVIAYNLARAPGVGSAIFLHVGDGLATAGCVSLPQAELVKVIRWLTPGSHPVITMGVIS